MTGNVCFIHVPQRWPWFIWEINLYRNEKLSVSLLNRSMVESLDVILGRLFMLTTLVRTVDRKKNTTHFTFSWGTDQVKVQLRALEGCLCAPGRLVLATILSYLNQGCPEEF